MDYVYPSIFFAYFLFLLLAGGAVYFFFKTIGHGYWGPLGEEPKFRMLADEEIDHGR